jgi:hypothetical protein
VSDCYTRVRARGKYTLLILDGHNSHVTQALIEYAHSSKILLLMFPRMLLTRFSRLMWRVTGCWCRLTLMSSVTAATPLRGRCLSLRLTFSRFFGQLGRRSSLKNLVVEAFKRWNLPTRCRRRAQEVQELNIKVAQHDPIAYSASACTRFT